MFQLLIGNMCFVRLEFGCWDQRTGHLSMLLVQKCIFTCTCTLHKGGHFDISNSVHYLSFNPRVVFIFINVSDLRQIWAARTGPTALECLKDETSNPEREQGWVRKNNNLTRQSKVDLLEICICFLASFGGFNLKSLFKSGSPKPMMSLRRNLLDQCSRVQVQTFQV